MQCISGATGGVSTVAPVPDSGDVSTALDRPVGIAVSSDGNYIIVSDSGNHCIRAIDKSTHRMTTLAGEAGEPGSVDGSPGSARFFFP